ncbi:type II secretion system protein [Duganella sp. HH105]|uniref:type II secretion system protein n=1 Tax=Duganella sp. HH105 TaxID=1781067 RepID=UPI00089408EE|nr:type II secretion system protein [Duganella sp. HH105]OEZ54890.1 hypothetical protein DUGA6_56610 [Duganella sp. HH105]
MHKQQGFSYVVVMFLVAVLSIVTVRALENTLTAERRDKEAQLLLVGQAYADAIGAYYNGGNGTQKKWPQTPKDLLEYVQLNRTFRPLRKLYRDPITGSKVWGYVYNGTDLVGVYSLSTLKPLKRDQFPANQASFKDAASYQNWKFVYVPQ